MKSLLHPILLLGLSLLCDRVGAQQITTLNPVIDLEGEWEARNSPLGRTYFLSLKRESFTNLGNNFIEMYYTGRVEVAFSARVGPSANTYVIHCSEGYNLRLRHQLSLLHPNPFGNDYTLTGGGTNVVELLPGEVEELTLSLNTSQGRGVARELSEGKLPLSVSYADRRGRAWDENWMDKCGIAPHLSQISDFGDFRRVAPLPPELKITGTIYGKVRSSQPTETDEPNAVHRAEVLLYEQDGHIRLRAQAESAEEYQEYLKAQRSRRLFIRVANLNTNDQGEFMFEGLPLYQSRIVGGASRYEPVRYSLEVRNAETDEFVIPEGGGPVDRSKTEVLYFALGERFNIVPFPEDHVIELNPFDGIGAKQALAEHLSVISPVNYGPAEQRVLSYLEQLRAMTDRSPESLEGLQRAIWAERAVRDSSQFAEELVKGMMEGLANLVADLLEDVKLLKSRQIRTREATIQQYEQKMQWDRAASRGWATTPTREALERNIQKLLNEDGAVAAEVADLFKKLMETGLFITKNALLTAGMEEGDAASALAVIEGILNTALNAAISQSVAGASGEVVKLAIKSAARPLFDGHSFSFTGRAAPHLELSAEKMQTWASANRLRYELDRADIVKVLGEMGAESTLVIQGLQFTTAAPDAIGITENIAELTGVKAAEWTVMGIKYANNALTIAAPAVLLFHKIPNWLDDVSLHAFGEFPMDRQGIGPLAMNMPSATINANLITEASTALAAMRNIVRGLEGKFPANDFNAVLEAVTGTNGLSVGDSHKKVQRTLDALIASTRGMEITNQDAAEKIGELEVAQGQVRVGFASVSGGLLEMALKAYMLDYSGPDDPVYVAQRGKWLRSAALLAEQVDAVSALAFNLFTMLPSRHAPVVHISELTAVSDASGSTRFAEAGEEFTVRARVRNISTWPLGNVTATLRVEPAELAEVIGEAAQDIGALANDDRLPETGSDEVWAEWTVRYKGSPENRLPVHLVIELQEAGTFPSSFIYVPARGTIHAANLEDRDFDGLPDEFESKVAGLNPEGDDALEDLDGDGLSNLREFEIGTNPSNRDTDNDGTADLEELIPGTDFAITNPLQKETGDEELFRYPAPTLTISPTVVVLNESESFARVAVTSGTGQPVPWTAWADNDALLTASPSAPELSEAGELWISSAGFLPLNSSGVAVTSVVVKDLLAGPGVEQSILVVINGELTDSPPLSARMEDGLVSLSWQAEDNVWHQVQASDDLKRWRSIATENGGQFAPEEVRFVDRAPAVRNARFFRVIAVKPGSPQ